MGKTKKIGVEEWEQLTADKEKLEKELHEKNAEIQKLAKVAADADSLQKTLDEKEKILKKEKDANEKKEKEVQEKQKELSQVQEQLGRTDEDLKKAIKTQERLQKNQTAAIEGNQGAKYFLDVTITSCEFARPAHYFVTVAASEDDEPRGA
jgi:chromosome segregation ATPase